MSMSGFLPQGWEADYDGSRWFYRYAPTGLTQSKFPKPGDEHGMKATLEEHGISTTGGYFDPSAFMMFEVDDGELSPVDAHGQYG